MTDWVRLWHDMPTDPKWRTIARKSGQRVGDVIAVFNFMLVNASGNASERGTMAGFDLEDVATALDLNETDIEAILNAMTGKVMDNRRRLTGWEKRQPKREDSTAFERKAAWKERQRNAVERSGTHGNAPETETETETYIPFSNENGAADPEKVMFDRGIEYLATCGVRPERSRPLLGKWKKNHGPGIVIEVLGAAQRQGAIEPISFIEAALKARNRPQAEPRIPAY